MTNKPLLYYYDNSAANRAVNFIEKFIIHVKGELSEKPFILEKWQSDEIIKPLFGWKRRRDKLRQYRTCYIEIPRKNGKSNLCAAIGLYLLFSDGEPGAEIYSAAGDRSQAGIVFEVAKRMVLQSEELSKRGKPFRNSIVCEKTNSFYHAISADADTKHGFNAHGILFDELHTQPDRDLWDVLTTSIGSRRQPLIIAITTAGWDKNSICWEIHEYARKVKAGILEDDTFLPVMYGADANDDIFNEETWRKANPGYGSIVKVDYIRNEAEKAAKLPDYENTFRRLHLNQWTSQESKWINDESWMKCNLGNLPDLTSRECYGGLDLASTRDINAFVLIFHNGDGTFEVMPFFFIPTLNAKERVRKDGVNYDQWIRAGLIIETPGDVTDYGYIRAKINELSNSFHINSISFDRWNSSQLVINLTDDGFTMSPFGQGFGSMSSPTKELEKMVLARQINHAGNSVLRWMCSNVMIQQDAAGNIKINKAKSSEKVDGMVALVMALGEYMTHNKNERSIYEDRGVVSI